jgi:hypothetical protein
MWYAALPHPQSHARPAHPSSSQDSFPATRSALLRGAMDPRVKAADNVASGEAHPGERVVARRFHTPNVMRGLDPRTHLSSQDSFLVVRSALLRSAMDPRVKPADDVEGGEVHPGTRRRVRRLHAPPTSCVGLTRAPISIHKTHSRRRAQRFFEARWIRGSSSRTTLKGGEAPGGNVVTAVARGPRNQPG